MQMLTTGKRIARMAIKSECDGRRWHLRMRDCLVCSAPTFGSCYAGCSHVKAHHQAPQCSQHNGYFKVGVVRSKTPCKYQLLGKGVPEPSAEVAALRLHTSIVKALKSQTLLNVLAECERERLFAVFIECALFDALFRQPWSAAVGDVALIETARSLEAVGAGKLL